MGNKSNPLIEARNTMTFKEGDLIKYGFHYFTDDASMIGIITRLEHGEEPTMLIKWLNNNIPPSRLWARLHGPQIQIIARVKK
jgi:hypothetical protein